MSQVVELGADGATQAAALEVLLNAAARDWRWSNDEPESLLPHMVAAVLASPRANNGVHMLQVRHRRLCGERGRLSCVFEFGIIYIQVTVTDNRTTV